MTCGHRLVEYRPTRRDSWKCDGDLGHGGHHHSYGGHRRWPNTGSPEDFERDYRGLDQPLADTGQTFVITPAEVTTVVADYVAERTGNDQAAQQLADRVLAQLERAVRKAALAAL